MPPKRRAKPRSARLHGLGKAVEEVRHTAEMSQQDLATRSGLHLTYVSKLEAGQRNPTFETLADLGAGLGISAATLVRRAEARAR